MAAGHFNQINKKPRQRAQGFNFLSIDDPVDRCQLPPGAGKFFIKSPLSAPRRVASSRASMLCGWNAGAVPRLRPNFQGPRVTTRASSFLTTTKSSQLPLPVPASITRVFCSYPSTCTLFASFARAPLPTSNQANPVPGTRSPRKTGACITTLPLTANKYYCL